MMKMWLSAIIFSSVLAVGLGASCAVLYEHSISIGEDNDHIRKIDVIDSTSIEYIGDDWNDAISGVEVTPGCVTYFIFRNY